MVTDRTKCEEKEERTGIKALLAKRQNYQFGQANQELVMSGGKSVGCGDTSVQLAVRIIKDKKVSLNRVRRASGAIHYTGYSSNSQLLKAFRAFGIEYRDALNLTPAMVKTCASKYGPVLMLYTYGWHPEWQGYTHGGRTADGEPNGYSRPLGKSGRNDMFFGTPVTGVTGKNGGHWATVCTIWRDDFIVRDSNHNSPARPERPAWDKLTAAQMSKMLTSRGKVGGYNICLVPKRYAVSLVAAQDMAGLRDTGAGGFEDEQFDLAEEEVEQYDGLEDVQVFEFGDPNAPEDEDGDEETDEPTEAPPDANEFTDEDEEVEVGEPEEDPDPGADDEEFPEEE
jgi:hypothetical protein